MAWFEFIARDKSGTERRGRIDADSREGAAMRLQRDSLQPVRITPVERAIGQIAVPPPAPSEDTTEKHRVQLARLLGRDSVPIVLSAVAIIISLGALAFALLHDPLGLGLEEYDFSTPEAALASMARIEKDQSVRAQMELAALLGRSDTEQRLKTCKISKKLSEESRTILFISYEIDGKPKKVCEAFEKHAETGYWLPTYISSYEIEDKDLGLARQMREWEGTDELMEKLRKRP